MTNMKHTEIQVGNFIGGHGSLAFGWCSAAVPGHDKTFKKYWSVWTVNLLQFSLISGVITSKSNSCVNFEAPFAGRILCDLKYFQQEKRSRNPASKFIAWMWTSTYQEQLTTPSWPNEYHLYLFTCEERSKELRWSKQTNT